MSALDHTDWRIVGKLRACESRKKPFSPGIRLIAHDLGVPVVTVWRRLWKLSRFGVVVVWKAPKRGLRYLWRTRGRYGPKRYTPCLRQEYPTQKQDRCRIESGRNGVESSQDPPRGPPVSPLAALLLSTELRSGVPWFVRRAALCKLARELAADGLEADGLRYLMRRARGRAPLLGWFLAKPERWRDVLLDRGLGMAEKRESGRRVSAAVTLDEPETGPSSLASLLGELAPGYARPT